MANQFSKFCDLSDQERMDVSIKEIKELSELLNRHPYRTEYEKMKNKGFSMFPLQKHFKMTYKEICNKFIPEFFIEVQEGYRKCSTCDLLLPLEEFNKDVKTCGGYVYSCKVCSYLKRKSNLIIKENWNLNEYKIIIDSIINNKIVFINELVDKVPSKSFKDITLLLSTDLIIANKALNVKSNCKYCQKETVDFLSVYLKSKNTFCSSNCYWKYKKEFEPKGEDSYQYNRIETKCTNCNLDIEVIPYDYNKKNKYNDNHNFCSQTCYWEYRSKYYLGEKHSQFGTKHTAKQRNAQRILTTKMYSTGIFDRQTKPQKEVNKLLKKLDIKYENEYNYKYYSVDNYILEHNLCIEVMGDYFHSNPLKYNCLNQMQQKDIKRDKSKHTYIKKYYKIEILYLWETDIMNNIKLCEHLIKFYIKNNGNLLEYNSFNYSIINNQLVLNNNIIKPYIEYKAKDIDNLLDRTERNKIRKLITFKCDNCYKDVEKSISLYNRTKKHFCSRKCSYDYNTDETKKNKINCNNCGQEYETYIINCKEGKLNFCSKKCHLEHQKLGSKIIKCDNCSSEFEITEGRFKNSKLHFCNRDCYMKYRTS